MADRKYATWMQWSVMWYSETSAGCKMAVMVGGASCWAGNRSQDFAGLRSRTSREQLVGEKREAGKGRGAKEEEEDAKDKTKERQRPNLPSYDRHRAFNFSLLMSSRRSRRRRRRRRRRHRSDVLTRGKSNYPRYNLVERAVLREFFGKGQWDRICRRSDCWYSWSRRW